MQTFPTWDASLVVAEATDISITTPTGLPLTTRAPVADEACKDQWWFSQAPGGPNAAANSNQERNLLVSTQGVQGWSQCNRAAAYAPGICYEGHDFKALTKVWTSNAGANWGGAPTSWLWKGICCRSDFDYTTVKLLNQGASTDLCTQILTLTTATGFRLLPAEGAFVTSGLTTIRTSTELEARHQPFTMWWNTEDLDMFGGDSRDYMVAVVKEAAAKSRVITAKETTATAGDAAAATNNSSSSPSPTDGAAPLMATARGLSGAAVAGIAIGSVLALALAVVVGLMLGRRRHRSNTGNPELRLAGQTEKDAAYRGGQHQQENSVASWISHILGGRRRKTHVSPLCYLPGHPDEGILAPEVVTGDHYHYPMKSELAGQPRSELCGDSCVGEATI
ncbi:uncharacterized protein PG998_013962 [Apiospora kogelbergensis]|uniref:uncharacterized protein n=1 Tax=Apiospora kogelbergensis TaxID=1337665 RepID=UPI00312CF3F9